MPKCPSQKTVKVLTDLPPQWWSWQMSIQEDAKVVPRQTEVSNLESKTL